MKKTLIIFTALCGLSGCGTVVKLIDPTEQYTAYAGTKYDWQMTQRWGLPILDLPLSFLLDTALLPYTWLQE
ncbi:YceK/YidQ family lipoprotein [Necropsobacter massiliensis]|uniref:YceK/YidQ family lipoprotein n=1 Tax=Necropsobacter massiliensis TaxID=1400001 RepID=UPI00059633BA|nr:YceK/YidQ family lipoprotein [Necropsobacter massiliensis]